MLTRLPTIITPQMPGRGEGLCCMLPDRVDDGEPVKLTGDEARIGWVAQSKLLAIVKKCNDGNVGRIFIGGKAAKVLCGTSAV